MIDAPQHRPPGPHPLPLFLDLVARVAIDDPDLARAALDGLRVYRAAPRPAPCQRPTFDMEGRARLTGIRRGRPIVVLIPSLINGSAILDLSPDLSLVDWLDREGYDALLLDWGIPAATESAMIIDDHVTRLLLPMLGRLGEPVHLLGYCLGGMIAIAAANLIRSRSLTLLATPWRFGGYPEADRDAMTRFWQDHESLSRRAGGMPIDWLQRLFWGLDPDRTVAKYAALAGLAADHPDVARFALVEDWSNGGAPVPWGAARQLFEDMIGKDRPGQGGWLIAGQKIAAATGNNSTHQIAAASDRIVPMATIAPDVPVTTIAGGHVGMIVGRHRVALRDQIAAQLAAAT